MVWAWAFFVMAAALYLSEAGARFSQMHRVVERTHAGHTWAANRGKFLLRAALWIVPSRLYHWRERRWKARAKNQSRVSEPD